MKIQLDVLEGTSLNDARDWQDMEEDDFDGLSAEAVTRGVHRHYDGGLIAFLQDAGIE